MGWEMLITAQSLKIQMNLIELTRMNARMPLDPQMHIFLCGMRKFWYTNTKEIICIHKHEMHVQIDACSCNSEFHRDKLTGIWLRIVR